jgi:hypothetical protein
MFFFFFFFFFLDFCFCFKVRVELSSSGLEELMLWSESELFLLEDDSFSQWMLLASRPLGCTGVSGHFCGSLLSGITLDSINFASICSSVIG